MPTVIATPAAVDANSYCTVAEADAYHATVLHAETWLTASTTTKQTALIMATRLLDAMFDWAEWRTTEEQALEWPRVGIMAKNQLDFLDEYEIPIELKNAEAEFARQLIDADRTADNAAETAGLSALTAGPISLTFTGGVVPKVVPDAVYWLLPAWWGSIRGSSGTFELMRG